MTPESYVKIWNRANATSTASIISRYYGGKNVPAEMLEKRIDGRQKSIITTNWTKIFADSHVAFMTSNDIKYFLWDNKEDPQAINDFKKFYEDNNVESLDSENILNAILYGFSVNIHSFDGEKITTEGTDPTSWALARDEKGDVAVAIYRVKLPPNTIYKDNILEKPLTLFYAYTDKEIVTVEMGADMKPTQTNVEEHSFGRIPITVFTVNKDATPFFNYAFFSAVDNFDIITGTMTDGIKYDTDSLLLTKGVKIDDLLSKDSEGKSNLIKIRENAWLPVAKDANAEYLEKGSTAEKFIAALSVTRDILHLQACVPDLQKLVLSGTSNISGIALRLLFTTQIQKTAQFAEWYKVGLRDRIDFFNIVNSKLGKPSLVNCEIRFDYNLPKNNVELLQYVGNLVDILSTKDKIRILDLVDNPEAAYDNLISEKEGKEPKLDPTAGAGEDVMVSKD